MAAELDQQEGERLGPDRQRAGEPRVLTARAERHWGGEAHARAAGAGARGLERAFAYCHTTWSQEFWAMRMHAARRDLLAPEETVTVSSVARKYGFEPGRFSAQYFRMFQEYPSQSLRLRQLGRQLS